MKKILIVLLLSLFTSVGFATTTNRTDVKENTEKFYKKISTQVTVDSETILFQKNENPTITKTFFLFKEKPKFSFVSKIVFNENAFSPTDNHKINSWCNSTAKRESITKNKAVLDRYKRYDFESNYNSNRSLPTETKFADSEVIQIK